MTCVSRYSPHVEVVDESSSSAGTKAVSMHVSAPPWKSTAGVSFQQSSAV